MAELLEVDEATMERLDRLEGYPNLYDRRKVTVSLPDGQADTAWVYVMNRLPDRARVIPGGDWREWRKGGQAMKRLPGYIMEEVRMGDKIKKW